MKRFVLILLLTLPCLAQEQQGPQYQYANIPLPFGGINTSTAGFLAEDEAAELNDFLFGQNELRYQKGLDLLVTASGFGSVPIDYIGLYRRSNGATRLILNISGKFVSWNAKDVTLNTDDWIVDTTYDESTVSGDVDSLFVDADGAVLWRSLFGDGGGLQLRIDSAGEDNWLEYEVDYIRDDSRIYLESALSYSPSTDNYFLTGGFGDIVFGETFVDSFWMLTERGQYVFGQELTQLTYDSTHYKYTDFDTTCFPYLSLLNNEVITRFENQDFSEEFSQAVELFQTAAHTYLFMEVPRILSDSAAAPGAGGYTLLPVYNVYYQYVWNPVGPSKWYPRVETYAAFASPRLDTAPDFSLHEVFVDHNSYVTSDVDSIVVDTAGWPNGLPIEYVRIVSGSLFKDGAELDFRKLESGDWFVVAGDTVIDTGTIWRYNVLGGWTNADTTAIYANEGIVATTVTDTQVTFYRRTSTGTYQGGYRVGTFWRNRLCSVHDSTSSQIDFSKAYYPESTSIYFVQVNPDDGEDILWLREMYGNLLIGKQSSIWRLNGIPGLDSYASLEKVWDGPSFVANRSIVTRNNLLFGLAADGFYVFDYNSMVKISHKIESFVTDSINWDYRNKIVAGFWDNHYWCAYPSYPLTVNSGCLVYSPDYQAWATSTLDFAAVMADESDLGADSARVYLGAVLSPAISNYGQGSQPLPVWETGPLVLGSVWHEKLINRLLLTFAAQTYVGSYPLVVTVYHDTIGLADSVLTGFYGSPERRTIKYAINGDLTRGYEHIFRINSWLGYGTRYTSIGGMSVEYLVESVDY